MAGEDISMRSPPWLHARERGALDTGDFLSVRCQHAETRGERGVLPARAIWKADAHGDETVGIIADVEAAHVREAADEQRGDDEQHHGQCRLHDDEREPQARFLHRTTPRATGLERVREIGARCMHRRNQTGQQSGAE